MRCTIVGRSVRVIVNIMIETLRKKKMEKIRNNNNTKTEKRDVNVFSNECTMTKIIIVGTGIAQFAQRFAFQKKKKHA